jgi:diguanylate cyclase (GGDEF)-like protein/PAS domain S-box-containing protein
LVELHTIFVTLYACVAVLSAVVTLVAWQHRAARGATSVALMMLGITIWSACYAVVWATLSRGPQIFWGRVTGLGSWMVPLGFLTLAFDVAGMERWRTPTRIGLIAIGSLLIDNVEWVNPGGFFPETFLAHQIGSFTHYAVVPSLLYWMFVAYALVLIGAAAVILLRVSLRSRGSARVQAILLLAGGVGPTLAGLITQSGPIPADLDLAPLAFLITGAVWLWAIVRGALLDVLPLARDALVEQMADGVVVFNGGDQAVDVNPAALTMLKTLAHEVIGMPAEVILGVVKGAADVLGGNDIRSAILPIGPEADSRYVDLGVTPIFVGLGSPPAQLVTMHDVTEERRASEDLKLFRQVFDTANEGIIITFPDTTIMDVNDAFLRIHGLTREEVLGNKPRMFQSGRHTADFYRMMWVALAEEGRWTGEIWDRRADGTEFPRLLSIAAVKDEQGEAHHYVGIFSDISAIKEAENKLTHLATHDSLTHLPNRALFDDRLAEVLARSRRDKTRTAVLFFDLDHFKDVNDTFGHAAGDRLLAEIAERCAGVVREQDTVGRYGGDEFAIIVSGYANASDLVLLAKRLLSVVEMPVGLGGSETARVTASIGITVYPEDGDDAAELIRHADVAMYLAKGRGRDRFEFFGKGRRGGSAAEARGA